MHTQCEDCGKCRATPNEDWCHECRYWSCERGEDCADLPENYEPTDAEIFAHYGQTKEYQ